MKGSGFTKERSDLHTFMRFTSALVARANRG
jgi:hypothetical protein